jgi:hypothetical protein
MSLAVLQATDVNNASPTNINTPPYSTPANYVGEYADNDSCVYIANGWCLACAHEGFPDAPPDPTAAFFNGQLYFTTGNYVRITNPDNTPTNPDPTDLFLFSLATSPTLSNMTLSSAPLTVGESFTNYGYGEDRTSAQQYYDSNFNVTADMSDAAYEGYNVGSDGVKESQGTNTILNLGTSEDPVVDTTYNLGFGNVTAFEGAFEPGSDMILSGDSGGGAFNSERQLIGINNAAGTYDNQPSDEALYGDVSAMIDISQYANQINSLTGVPEPTSAVLLLASLPVLTWRRRRA